MNIHHPSPETRSQAEDGQAVFCSSISDCPSRFKCYPPGLDSPDGGKQCSCSRPMLFSGPDCMNVDGLAVLTFCFAFYVMLRCANHSYQVFNIRLKKWKMERQVERRGSASSLPLIASLWILAASLFFTICCAMNAGRMFTAGYRDKTIMSLVEFCFAFGELFMVLASNIMGLFWGQTALWHEAGTARALSFIRTYRRYSFVLSLVFLTVVALIGTRFYELGFIAYLLFWAPLILTVSIVCAGTCLIQRELNTLSESSPQSIIKRALSNIRRSACKILSHTILTIFISAAFFILEDMPEGANPKIINHLLLVALYVNINMTLIAMGEYLVCTDKKYECACAPKKLIMQMMGRVPQEGDIRRVFPEQQENIAPVAADDVLHADIQRSRSAMRTILGIPPPADYLLPAQVDILASIAEEQHQLSEVEVHSEAGVYAQGDYSQQSSGPSTEMRQRKSETDVVPHTDIERSSSEGVRYSAVYEEGEGADESLRVNLGKVMGGGQ